MIEKFERICPICKEIIYYSSKYNRNSSEKKLKKCRKCDYNLRKTKYLGENNPFYGKKHSIETLKKQSCIKIGKYKGVSNSLKSNKKEKNGMFGKTFYSIWVEKYGKIVADNKMENFKKKQSLNNKGEKNGMFGKVSPIGTGNGICGWYKKWFFRSLHELTYMIYVIERFNIKWESAEKQKYRVKYVDENNITRNYFPDLILNNKYVVEIKPKALRKTKLNLYKFEQAEKYFKTLKFKVVSVRKNISFLELKKLIDSKSVILTDKWNKKLKI